MINLYAAEYKGKALLFRDTEGAEGVVSECLDEFFLISKSKLTNIAPVKVVPAEAIVLDKSDAQNIVAISLRNPHWLMPESLRKELIEKLLAQFRPLPTPMAEPKGFGAIVEAGCKGFLPGGERVKWVTNASSTPRSGKWFSAETSKGFLTVTWGSLTNPTLISKEISDERSNLQND